MSIFDNIIFDEFTILEGEQAEAYKKRKEEEKRKAHADETHKLSERNARKIDIKGEFDDVRSNKEKLATYHADRKTTQTVKDRRKEGKSTSPNNSLYMHDAIARHTRKQMK